MQQKPNSSDMDFSICSKCLADQTRLTRNADGAECKICTLPFTVYHFKADSKTKRTVICHNCSKQRNVCQCCLLDLQWQIPIELRDRVLSALQDSQVTTAEAQNEMMKRFIALKNGDSHKLGGASVTSDANNTAQVLARMQERVADLQDSLSTTEKATNVKAAVSAPSGREGADISHLTKKLPLKSSLLEPSQSFFLYNIDPSMAEWAIVDAVSGIAGTPSWQDPMSTSVVINHLARCGGIRFKSSELAQRFQNGLDTFQTASKVTKGKLPVSNSKIHVVAWPQFHRAALGNKNTECLQLAKVLDTLVQRDLVPLPGVRPNIKETSKVGKPRKNRGTNKSKKSRRIMDIEL
ncbi:LADA_0H06612g1_1 [Lachancea dasiensis]|uniref:Pre-mRNA-splicing factor SLT11 n=1 Tax=Lachancea dasiensis TaxID=1072105 RepID=A0A1G4K1Q7_9SACH|nr:LADA_0H06612g1_1 [Lachancea dasiensis]